ncbi:MAG: hypothetical protein HYU66_02855 [Armatimonadetes bacterium]|nr:hypothetical protein [Armatimonadota bacterium]
MVEPLTLAWKPDLAEATQRWLAFWNQEILDRPVCSITAPRDGVKPVGGPPYLAGAKGDFGPVIDQVLAWGETVYWGGDAIPAYTPSFGPDQISAWLGAELVIPEENYGTDWVPACIDDWDAWLPFQLDPDNYWWRRMNDFMRALAAALDGKMVISHLDLHSNMDTLLAMRGGERLCLDMVESPEVIDRAMTSVRRFYAPVYDALYESGNMGRTGTLGWVPAYHPVKTNTIQCDFAALIGPHHFRRWVMPALEEEAAHLGHCVYHLDGPECLVHVPDLCRIPGLDCIQWTTGARNAAFIEWMDLLKDIQARGTSLWIPCNTEDIKVFHKELDPTKVFYNCWAPSEKAAEETLGWLVENT